MHGLAVNQDERVFRPHAAQVNLPVVAALAAGGVAREVHARLLAHHFGQVARRGRLQVLPRDGGHARRLLPSLLGGIDHFHLLQGGRFVIGCVLCRLPRLRQRALRRQQRSRACHGAQMPCLAHALFPFVQKGVIVR